MKNLFCHSSTLKNEAAVEKHFLDRLLDDLGYEDTEILPKTSIKALKVGKGSKSDRYKPDYVILSQGVPVLIIDAKTPEEDIHVWTSQCSSHCLELNKKFEYNPVIFFMLSNGFTTAVYKWDQAESLLELDFSDFQSANPKYEELKKLISRKALLKAAVKEREGIDNEPFALARVSVGELIAKFQKIHTYIWKKEKKKPSAVFEQLIKIVFVKLRKDRDHHAKFGTDPKPKHKDIVFSRYWINNQSQSENPINDILFRHLTKELETEISKNHEKRIFDEGEEIDLAPDTIGWVVNELENIDLFGMEEDIHGRMFESFLEATARGKELGQFFTPRDIVELMVQLADITVTKQHIDTVLDACCGSGGFLISAMREMLRKERLIPALSDKDREPLDRRIRSESLFGVDAGSAPKIYRIARMNMYLHGDGGSNIFFADSLDKNIGMVGKSSVEYNLEIDELRQLLLRDQTRFDVILSNPPFSMTRSSWGKERLCRQWRRVNLQTRPIGFNSGLHGRRELQALL
ncbi:MAG: N-6 DNA methylase [Bryobacteraceae bacterium]|jgi:type I restriction enzyme M protein